MNFTPSCSGSGIDSTPLDAGQYLEASLGLGTLRTVGATTQEEYQTIESDAFSRRFAKVTIEGAA